MAFLKIEWITVLLNANKYCYYKTFRSIGQRCTTFFHFFSLDILPIFQDVYYVPLKKTNDVYYVVSVHVKIWESYLAKNKKIKIWES